MAIFVPKSVDLGTAFSPMTPLRDASHFVGRKEELERSLDALVTPGAHLVVYGPRGIGKTSLVNVVIHLLGREGSDCRVTRYTCSHGDHYQQIFGAYLEKTVTRRD